VVLYGVVLKQISYLAVKAYSIVDAVLAAHDIRFDCLL
jgi:hypothetical protein